MNYETALALKEAGFPQALDSDLFIWWDGKRERTGGFSEIMRSGMESSEPLIAYAVPTLTELIEELGEDFHNLHKWNGSHEDKWVCNFRTDNKTIEWDSSGPTMESAAANLYLSLHGKKD